MARLGEVIPKTGQQQDALDRCCEAHGGAECEVQMTRTHREGALMFVAVAGRSYVFYEDGKGKRIA